MFSGKSFHLLLLALTIISLVSSQVAVPTHAQETPTLPASASSHLKDKKITPADRRAAAAHNATRGLLPGVAGAKVQASSSATTDPTTPHYFGPFANYANSPLPTGSITALEVDSGGSDYTDPQVTIADAYGTGSGAQVKATVDKGVITDLILLDGGSGYSAPVVVIQDTTGSGASATPSLGSTLRGGIRKFVDSLPGLDPAGVNNLGQYMPVAVPDTTTYPGSDYYEIELGQYTEQMHSDLPPTTLRGYRQTNLAGGPPPFHYLGPVIITRRDVPVRVKFTNHLPTGEGGNLFLPVDTTVMGAGMGPLDMPGMKGMKENYTQNRATLHLHGGITPWISDGTPHQWITPAGEKTQYPKGVSVRNVPDMPDPGDGSMTFFYSNQQSARFMFYHDHSYGITRLNVYAGEEATYLITDKVEQDLIHGTNTSGVNPNLEKILPDLGLPLVIQDRTFVDATTIGAQDPNWRWGTGPVINPATGARRPKTGDLWLPSVYMPAQNPWDLSGASAFGRWMYGPYFWPPTTDITHKPVPNEYYDPTCDPEASWCEPPYRPDMPNPSMGMEAFMDTPLINGTAYPYMVVDPKTYRFRILNGANDRFFNLQFYVADPTVTTATGISNTEVAMVAAVTTKRFPPSWPTDGRAGGVPDPATAGPSWIQIGTEGGFLPAPVVIPSQPIAWNTNPTAFNFGNVTDHALLLGPAERADVLVDFSQFAGQTLILYNDAPAAFPALDPRYDYYTGNPNQMDTGGAPTTQPGYGPNTRTIMQIRVAAKTPAPAYNLVALNKSFATTGTKPGVFATSQDSIIIPQAAYNSAYNANYPGDTRAYVQLHEVSKTFYNGSLTGLTLTDSGKGYTTAPQVSITGGGGSGARAMTTLGPAELISVTVTNGGANYATAPTVSFTGGGGSGAQAVANLAPAAVAALSLQNGGSGYTSPPAITISGGGGSGATATATVGNNRRITSVTLINGGSGYTSAPVVTISGGGGNGARVTATLTRVAVASITLTNGGSGYSSAPTISLAGGGGSGATATALLGARPVASISLQDPGTGYTSAPRVVFSGGGGSGATAVAKGITLALEPKSMHDEMGAVYDTEYGRMSGMLGLEVENTTATNQNFVMYGYASPPVEILKDSMTPLGTLADGTQIWKITHNGVDTHPLHFHLVNVQLINRVAWDGALMPPEPNELGWKETVRVNPLEHTIIAMRPVASTQPFEVPNSVRLIDPTLPEGAPLMTPPIGFVDKSGTQVTVLNHLVNFGWEYIWHCHILSHEEMDMMHTMAFAVAPKAPSGLTATYVKNNQRRVTLTWTDHAANESGFIVQRATSPTGPWSTITSAIPEASGAGGKVTYDDSSVQNGQTYYYRVLATNVVGDTEVYPSPATGFYTTTMNSSATSGVAITISGNNGSGTPFLFASNFESGLNNWSGVVGQVSLNPQAAMGSVGGAQGMAAVLGAGGAVMQAASATIAQAAYVFDTSPENEVTYNAGFYFNPNSTRTGDGPVDIFVALAPNHQPIFGIQYEQDDPSADSGEIRAWVLQAGQQFFTEWFPATNASHSIQIAWHSADKAGFSLFVDGSLVDTLTVQTSPYLVDAVRLGPSSGLSANSDGVMYFDEFVSSQTNGVQYDIYFPWMENQKGKPEQEGIESLSQ